MTRKILFRCLAVILGLGFLTACALLSPKASFSPIHPQAVTGRPMCSECHGTETFQGAVKAYGSFDHTPEFVKDHRFQANRDSGACATCHAQSFCSDCHGGKVAMKPATKLSDRPDRLAPHRGDYMSLHRIEGKMDPSACYKCHGRANNDKCRVCHR